MSMSRAIFASLIVIAGALAASGPRAAEPVKIALSIPITGPFAENGKQMLTAAKLFMERNGTSVAGRTIELTIRDDAGVADQAKRIAQELVVNNKVAVLMGYNPTPAALAVAPLATQARVPQIVTGSSASITTERSPYIVRTFSTQPQITVPMAQWAARHGAKRVVTMVTDYAPGIETEKAFTDEFKTLGGEIIEAIRVPLRNPDFAPYLQRARDAKPDTLFVWVPGGLAAPLLRQYAERGLNASGIKLIGTGDITDDAVVNELGEPVVGIVTSLQYSVAHPSAANKAFVEGFRRLGNGMRPDHVGIAVYDGLHLVYAALEKTGGYSDGDALIAAMKGLSWESPRGPVMVDPETRDLVQNVYIRRVERVDGELYNVEFDTFEAVRDPHKSAKK